LTKINVKRVDDDEEEVREVDEKRKMKKNPKVLKQHEKN